MQHRTPQKLENRAVLKLVSALVGRYFVFAGPGLD